MSETPKLLMEKDGAIGWIIFNQPEKRNAVSLEMWELMPKYVEDLASDDAVRVVVLRGAGDQALAAQRLLARGRAGVPPLVSALRDKDTVLAVLTGLPAIASPSAART